MSIKYKEVDSPLGPLKNESARQRWEMFHRAIAQAKQCNDAALTEADGGTEDGDNAGRQLSIVR